MSDENKTLSQTTIALIQVINELIDITAKISNFESDKMLRNIKELSNYVKGLSPGVDLSDVNPHNLHNGPTAGNSEESSPTDQKLFSGQYTKVAIETKTYNVFYSINFAIDEMGQVPGTTTFASRLRANREAESLNGLLEWMVNYYAGNN